MAAPTNIYVDPSIAANSGAGTSGDPYGDLQYALDQVTRDSTNGDQFNVKAGTDEILAAILTLATYGTPTSAAPVIFRGYASVANDGDFEAGTGIGGIDANAGSGIITSSPQYVHFVHMHLHNCGANRILSLGTTGCSVAQCELDNGTAGGIAATNGKVVGCHLHNISGTGISVGHAHFNYLKNGTNDFTTGIQNSSAANPVITHNILSLDGSSKGISFTRDTTTVTNNSVLCSAGTGTGLLFDTLRHTVTLLNNLVEGFSGVGGKGIDGTNQPEGYNIYGANSLYNNTTDFANDADVVYDLGSNESLGSSPFAKSGADTFANRFNYFAPNDVGSVQGGAFPSVTRLDRGAVQHADPVGGGGGLLTHPGMSGGMRG